jgi:hypothetical protein
MCLLHVLVSRGCEIGCHRAVFRVCSGWIFPFQSSSRGGGASIVPAALGIGRITPPCGY